MGINTGTKKTLYFFSKVLFLLLTLTFTKSLYATTVHVEKDCDNNCNNGSVIGDYGNDKEHAFPIEIDSIVEGMIDHDGADSDFFKIELDKDTHISITVLAHIPHYLLPGWQGAAPSHLKIYDVNGTELKATTSPSIYGWDSRYYNSTADAYLHSGITAINRNLGPGTYYVRFKFGSSYFYADTNMQKIAAHNGYYTLKYVKDTKFTSLFNTAYYREAYGKHKTRKYEKIKINNVKNLNIHGRIELIGNQSICQKNATTFLCDDLRFGITNNGVSQQPVNYDYADHPELENSTMAKLNLKPGDKVLWAGLYWQGRVWTSGASGWMQSARADFANRVKLKLPNHSEYISIESEPDKFNWQNYSSTFNFSGVKDITELVKKGRGGEYWVANVQATTYSGNMTAGWAIAVVVQNENDNLSNIAVYDGYRGYPVEHDIKIDFKGFLTPAKGVVDSKFYIFASEGDWDLTSYLSLTDIDGVPIELENDINRRFYALNGTISDSNGKNITDRKPNSANTLSIDVDAFDLSEILGNKQSETTLHFGDGGDHVFGSFMGFVTKLYEPRVCYGLNSIKDGSTTYYDEGEFKKKIPKNKDLEFIFFIANMKMDKHDVNLGDSEKTQVSLFKTDFTYTEKSTSIQNIGESGFTEMSDNPGDDKSETSTFDNKERNVWRVGTGADISKGGLIKPADSFKDDTQKAFIKFSGKFNADIEVGESKLEDFFTFKASFKTEYMELDVMNPQAIGKCQDFNSTFDAVNIGNFNVVHKGGSNDENNLYTQIVDKPFEVDVLSLDDDNNSISFTGEVSLKINPDCVKDDLSGITNWDNTVEFDDKAEKTVSLFSPIAYKSAYIVVRTKSNPDKEDYKYSCSKDVFAIRPASYKIVLHDDPLIGGKITDMSESIAISESGSKAIRKYTTDDTVNVRSDFTGPTSCSTVGLPLDHKISFTHGKCNGTYNYKNVGKVKITLLDDTWTKVDQDDGDCIADDFNNSIRGGKVGCNISSSKEFTFIPNGFVNTLTLSDFNSTGFTYINDDRNMTAPLVLNTTAALFDGTAASNYENGCYAKDINTTISLRGTSVVWDDNWTNESNATQRIRFFDDQSITSKVENNATKAQTTFSSPRSLFTSGIANINMFFNFQRFTNIPDNPFHVARNDFNVTVIDSDGIRGDDFNRSALSNYNATFYYGQVYVQDYSFPTNIGNATINYGVFSSFNTARRATFNLIGQQIPYRVNWYHNTQHINDSFGDYNQTAPNFVNHIDNLTPVDLDTLRLQVNRVPHKDTIILTPEPWLVFNKYDSSASTTRFSVEFLDGGSGWAGEGSLGDTVDTNVSTVQNKRLDW